MVPGFSEFSSCTRNRVYDIDRVTIICATKKGTLIEIRRFRNSNQLIGLLFKRQTLQKIPWKLCSIMSLPNHPSNQERKSRDEDQFDQSELLLEVDSWGSEVSVCSHCHLAWSWISWKEPLFSCDRFQPPGQLLCWVLSGV